MPRYCLSFTAASLMPQECRIIASQYSETPEWSAVVRETVSKNLLGKTRTSTAKQQTGELVKRLKTLDTHLVTAIPHVKLLTISQICFLSVMNTYDFVADFVNEVLYIKWMEGKSRIYPVDFINFYERKAITYPNLNTVADSTQRKVRSILMHMLEQAGYIESAKNGTIIPVPDDVEFSLLTGNELINYRQCVGV